MRYSQIGLDVLKRKQFNAGEKEKQNISLCALGRGSWHDLSSRETIWPHIIKPSTSHAIWLSSSTSGKIVNGNNPLCYMHLFVHRSSSQFRTVLFFRKYLAMSGEIPGCHNLREGVLLHGVGGGQPCSLTSYNSQDDPPPKLRIIQPKMAIGLKLKMPGWCVYLSAQYPQTKDQLNMVPL